MRATKKTNIKNEFNCNYLESEKIALIDKENPGKAVAIFLNKLGQYEDIEEWFSKKKFYGKALNEPNKILELKFEKIDFRPEEDLLFIHFEVLNSWASNIFYNIFSYGRTWALTKEELL